MVSDTNKTSTTVVDVTFFIDTGCWSIVSLKRKREENKMKNIFYKIIKIVFLIIGGIIITILSIQIPIDGLKLSSDWWCGEPAGLPFAYIGVWRCKECAHPACVLNFDKLALILDIVFWSLTLFLFTKLLKALLRKKKI